jgi:hypothetical protein
MIQSSGPSIHLNHIPIHVSSEDSTRVHAPGPNQSSVRYRHAILLRDWFVSKPTRETTLGRCDADAKVSLMHDDASTPHLLA